MSKTKTTAEKFAAGVVSLAMAFSFVFGGAVAPAQAQTAEELSAIIANLNAQIAALTSQLTALTGGSTTSPTAGGNGFVFSVNLSSGDTGSDVMELQKFLNSDPATQVSLSGAGSPGNETSYFGPATKAAVVKFQDKYASEVLAPVGLASGTGYFGSSSRAKANALNAASVTPTPPTSGGGTVVVPTGSTLNVSLAATSPSGTALVAGQAIGDLAHFTFTNTSAEAANVTKLVFNRTGVSNDTTLNDVYLFEGAVRLSDSASVSSGKITLSNPSGLFTVPAGSTKTISVRADVAASTSGQLIGVALSTVESNVTVSAAFPVTGANQSVAEADIATVDFNATTLPSGSSVAPQNDYTVWQNTASIGTRAVDLSSFALRNVGSVDDTKDIVNLRLYVDGVQAGSAVSNLNADGYVTFDLLSSPVRLNTGGRVIKVVGDIIGGSTETFKFQLKESSDAMLVDSQLGQPVLATVNGGSSFSIREATQATIDGGAVSVSKANNSPTDDVTVDTTNELWGSFEFRASGEVVKIENLDVQVNTTGSNGGLDNGQVFVNGVQVGSTKDLTEATDVNFTFGSSFQIPAGETAIVNIYADGKTTTAASYESGDTVAVTIGAGSSNAEGLSSSSSLSVPSSDTAANTLTFASSSLTVSESTGYGDQTLIAGTNEAKLGSFVLSAGSAEGVNVNTITVVLSADEAASVTNLKIMNGSTQVGTTKTTPSTSNSFSVNADIVESGTLTLDVVADILANADDGSWTSNIDADGTGSVTGNSVSATATDIQTITLGSGSLTVALGAGDPDSENVVAGSSDVHVAQFRFSATNADFTVQKVKIGVEDASIADSVSSITVKYEDASGTQQSVTQAIQTATSTFTGLTMHVPADDSANMDVYVNIPDQSSNGNSGDAINVTLDYDTGFKAVDSAGTAVTSVGSSDLSGGGTFYPFVSIPTFAKVSSGVSFPSTSIPFYKFKITADSADDIEWKKLSFTVSTTGVTVSDMYLQESGKSSDVNTSAVNANGSGVVAIYSGTSANNSVESISAGATRTYELRGTVTGWGDDGDSLVVSFTEDSSFTTPASSAGLSTNMIWSDVSASSHTTITSDWQGGYLIDDLSNDVQTYSE